MIGEHQETKMKMLYGCPFEKKEKGFFRLKSLHNKKAQKKFGVPDKKAVFLLRKGPLYCRVPQIFLALLILKRLQKLAIELLKHDTFLTNYLKLQILAPYNNLRIEQDSEFAQFSPRALLMSKLAKLLPLSCLKRHFLKVLQ